MSEKPTLIDLEGLIKMLEYVPPSAQEKLKKIIKAAFISGEPETARDANEIMTLKGINHILDADPYFPYPEQSDIQGEIKLGHVVQTGDPAYLKRDSLNKNILITGAHGTGKTNTINIIIQGLLENKIPFLVIGVAKKDYRHLIKIFPEIQVIRAAKEFKFNPLRPPKGTPPIEGLSDFIDAHTHLMDVMMRSKSILVGIVDKLLRMFGVYKGSNEYPNMEDLEDWLYEKLKRAGYRGDDFLLRNYQRCHMLNTLTNIFKCREGSDIEEMLETPTILELDGLQNDVINTVIIHLLTWILRYRLTKGQRGKLLHVTIIDECKRIFDRTIELNYLMRIPPIDNLVSYAREFGEGLVAADQEISKLTHTLRANTNTKISLFTSGIELEEIRKTFNLDEEQIKVVGELPTGTGIIKMEEG